MTPEQREQAIEQIARKVWAGAPVHCESGEGGYWDYTQATAAFVYDEVVAPLLVEARRSGLEQGFDECWIGYVAAAGDPPALNPYRSQQPEPSDGAT